MGIFSDISPDTALFPWAKRTPMRGLESTIAVAVALVLGQLTGHSSAGAIAAGSAFTVGFAVFHEALASSLLSMGLLTLGISSATLAGSLGASRGWAVFALAVVAAINYGLLAGLSPTAGWMGQQCAVFVVIASGFSGGHRYAVGRAAMTMLGGAMQMAVWAAGYALRRSGTAQPSHVRQFRTRAGQLWRELRKELHWDAQTNGYVLRLVSVLLLSTAIYRRLPYGNGYWAPMTALLVLKPTWSNTLSRGIARLTGTLLGAGAALLVAHGPPPPLLVLYLLVLVFAWACFDLQAVNYAFFSFCLTLYTVFSFRLGGFSQPAAAHLRLLNTAIGGGLALLVDFLWQQLPARFGGAKFVQ